VKRSEMLVEMQRVYGIRHVMVESGHLTLEQFMDELLTRMQDKGMLPPRTDLVIAGQTFQDHFWESEEVCPVVKAYKDSK
jgi:hypothetical protein